MQVFFPLFVRHSTHLSGAGVPDLGVQAGVHGVGQGTAAGQQPGGHHDPHGPRQAGDGVRPERVADGHVAVHGEGGDGQHAGVGGHLGHEGLDDAEAGPEAPGVGLPDGRHLGRKGWKQSRLAVMIQKVTARMIIIITMTVLTLMMMIIMITTTIMTTTTMTITITMMLLLLLI